MSSFKWCICTLVFLISLFPASMASTISLQNSKELVSMVVDPFGQQGFRTIQEAIDAVPSDNQRWTRIDIKRGAYWEQVTIPRDKPFIYLRGRGKRKTFIIWNGYDNIVNGATFASEANNTLARGITFVNAHNSGNNLPMARAVAARIHGDKSAFFKCGFFSLQDTLWDVEGRHYFKGCTIRGSVDFIFGDGQSLYESCTISVAPLDGIQGFITAQARGVPQDTSGFVFKRCKIVGKGKAYLGRPWRPYARVLFYDTLMSEAVVPQGWGLWDTSSSASQLMMSEFNSRGPGANSSERVKWMKKLTEEEASRLASLSFIDNEGWVETAFNIFASL